VSSETFANPFSIHVEILERCPVNLNIPALKTGAPKHKIVIFSKEASTVLIKFKRFMETSLNIMGGNFRKIAVCTLRAQTQKSISSKPSLPVKAV
jgi:hypothetical protein